MVDLRSRHSQSGESYLPAVLVLVALAGIIGSFIALTANPPGPKGPAVGNLTLVTNPPGALAHFDGRALGRTPAAAEGVETGEHLVKLELGGYLTYTSRHSLDLGQPDAELRIDLRPEPKGTISISSDPEGAKAYISGEFRGHTPLVVPDLAAGTYTVLVRQTNCEPWTASVNVPPGGTVPLEAKLEDKVLRFLLAAVEAEPTNVDHFTDLGHYYFIRGMVKESVAAYAKGLELSYMTDIVKGDTRRHDKEIKKHLKWPSAIAATFRAMIAAEQLRLAAKYPANVVTARQTARALIQQGNPKKAIEVLLVAINNVPENVEARYELGRAYLAAKECNKAIMSFESALEVAPADLYLKRRIAADCIDKRPTFGSDDDRRALSKLAKEALGEVVKRGVDRYAKAKAHYDLGRLYAEEELLEHAAHHMSEAVTLGTKGVALVQWQVDLAGVHARLGQTVKARELYRRVLHVGFDGAEALKRTAAKALEKLDESSPEK